MVFTLKEVIAGPEGQFYILLCDINNCPYTLVGVHAPKTHQIRFLHKLLSKIDKVKHGNLILCGDFNVTANPHIDSTSPVKHYLPGLASPGGFI